METEKKHVGHLYPLTGLRFYAAIAVFVSHIPVINQAQFKYPFPFGAAAVCFFFVLSGFVLTYVYCAEGKSFSAKTFFLRRFARVWPLHIATSLFTLFVLIPGFLNFEYGPLRLLMNLTLTQSWIPYQGWATSLNGVAWTLSVDVFLYLLFPLLILGGYRHYLWKLLLVVVATIAMLSLIESYAPVTTFSEKQHFVRFFPPMIVCQFVVGIGLGYLFNRGFRYRSRSLAIDTCVEFASFGLLLACLMICANLGWYDISGSTVHWGYWNYFRFAGMLPILAPIVIVLATSQGLLSRFLSLPVSVFLGKCSYGYYLAHVVVMRCLMMFFQWQDTPDRLYVLLAGSFLLTMVTAVVLHLFVEEPCRRWLIGACSKDKKIDWSVWWTATRQFLQPKCLVPNLAMLGLATFLLAGQVYRADRDPAVAEIIAQTPTEFQGIQFEGSAELLGYRATKHRGGIRLEIVWHLYPDRRQRRFVHICNSEGKILGQGPVNRVVESNARYEMKLIDRVDLTRDKLQDASSIAVGFFDPVELTSALVDRGPRGMGNHRLVLLNREQLNALR